MTDAAARAILRRAAAHVLVSDVAAPVLDDASAHHVFRVLRVRDGDAITVTDGCGGWRACRASGGGVVPDGEPHREPRHQMPRTVALAIPKADRPGKLVEMDFSSGDGWEKLCPFLGLPVPAKPFPHANKAEGRKPLARAIRGAKTAVKALLGR